MVDQSVKLNDSVYNTMALTYILANQHDKTISVVSEAVGNGTWDLITMGHLTAAYINKIKCENDGAERKKCYKFLKKKFQTFAEMKRDAVKVDRNL